MHIRHTASLIGLLCLIVTGCTTPSRGEPIPVTTSESSTTASTPTPSGDEDNLPSHGAPKVEVPLDNTSRFERDPCLTLTSSQAQELNLPTAGKPDDIPYGVGCEWRNPDTRGMVSIGFLTGNKRGLSAIYASDQRGEFAYFTPLPDVDGYPAAASDVEDRRPDGRCIIDVGVTDQLIIDIVLQLSQANVGEKDPCEVAVDVAGMALRTIKEGA